MHSVYVMEFVRWQDKNNEDIYLCYADGVTFGTVDCYWTQSSHGA